MRKVDSKDFWYFGMASVILSFLAKDFLAALGLLMAAFFCFFCLIFYLISKKEEIKRENLISHLKSLNTMAFTLNGLMDNLEKIEKRETTKRKSKPKKKRR